MAKVTRLDAMPCSVARALDVVGEWWTMLIVRDVLSGWTRFEDLHRRLGIARTVLAARLDRLVENEVLERQQYQDRPPRFEYLPTQKCNDLAPVLVALMQWGDKWAADEDGPPVALVHRTCGSTMSPTYHCDGCGDSIEADDVRLEPLRPTAPGSRT